MSRDDETDVCVVGAGAGGALAAYELVRRGVRVRLLETGPRYDPSSFGTHAPDFETQRSRFRAVVKQAPRVYVAAEGEPLPRKFLYLLSWSPSRHSGPRRGRRARWRYSRSLGVGGSTLHYQGEAHRFPPHAFRMRSEHGVAADWPITYEELAPYYARVEKLLDVAGDPANPFKARRGPYPHRAHPLSRASLRIGEGARALGWSHLPNPLAVLSRAQNGREACHYCNGCTHGCMVGAKSSVDLAVIPRAEATGLLELETGFHATRLEHARDGRVTGVLGYDEEGREVRRRAKAVVLATGAVQTPRILLNSAGGAHPHGVGNEHGQVGRHFMEFLFVKLRLLFDEPLEASAGLPIDSKVWDFNGARGEGKVPNGFVLSQSAGPYLSPAIAATEGIPGFGMAHREEMARRFHHGVQLLGFAEQLPREENRIALSAEKRDRFGAPLAQVETRLDENDLGVLGQMWERLHDLAEASGAAELVGVVSAFDAPYATHVGGTCRMGRDPRGAVTDASGAVHGHPNLVIADASALVTQGAGDSPSLTIQALALRAAEALAERARKSDLAG